MGYLFAELKRRNVVRVGFAYIVVGWLAIQLVNEVAPIIEAPDWISKVVFILLLAGLPVALILARAYELRQTAEFHQIVSEQELPRYWAIYGWPGQCRPLGGGEFQYE